MKTYVDKYFNNEIRFFLLSNFILNSNLDVLIFTWKHKYWKASGSPASDLCSFCDVLTRVRFAKFLLRKFFGFERFKGNFLFCCLFIVTIVFIRLLLWYLPSINCCSLYISDIFHITRFLLDFHITRCCLATVYSTEQNHSKGTGLVGLTYLRFVSSLPSFNCIFKLLLLFICQVFISYKVSYILFPC